MKINLREMLKIQMAIAGISISRMARIIDCHQGTLYNFFSGKSELSSDKIDKILNVLKAKIVFRYQKRKG